MPFAAFNGQAQDITGAVVAGVSVEVRQEISGSPLAAIFSDRDGLVPLGNPYTTDVLDKGSFRFHAAGGAYRIRVFTSGSFEKVWRFVSIGLGAETDNPVGVNSNSDITTPIRNFGITGYQDFAELPSSPDPDNPSPNTARLYAKDNGLGVTKLYYRDNGGLESELPGTGSGSGALLALTGAATIVAADNGKNVTVNGYFELGLTAAATLGNAFGFFLSNTGTRRVIVNPNGAELIDGRATLELWPGMSCRISCNATGFFTVGLQPRWLILASTTINVDPVNGNNANDGLATGSGNALATLTAGVTMLYNKIDCGGNTVTIQGVSGTYNEGIALSGRPTGFQFFILRGDETTPGNCIINAPLNTPCVYAKNAAIVKVHGWRLQGASTGTFGLLSEMYGHIDYQKIEWGACPGGRHRSVTRFSSCEATGTSEIVGNADFHLVIQQNGFDDPSTHDVAINANRAFTTFILAQQNAQFARGVGMDYVLGGGVAVTGKRYDVFSNSIVTVSGGGINFFPGNAAGTTTDAGTLYQA